MVLKAAKAFFFFFQRERSKERVKKQEKHWLTIFELYNSAWLGSACALNRVLQRMLQSVPAHAWSLVGGPHDCDGVDLVTTHKS